MGCNVLMTRFEADEHIVSVQGARYGEINIEKLNKARLAEGRLPDDGSSGRRGFGK
jgi:hypothetical protein